MLKEKIRNLIAKKTEGDSKKTIENLIVFLILLIITVISINLIWGNDNKGKDKELEECTFKPQINKNSKIQKAQGANRFEEMFKKGSENQYHHTQRIYTQYLLMAL